MRLCGLLAAVVLARALGPTGRGIIAAAMIWPTAVLTVGAIVNVQTVAYFSARFGREGLQTCLFLALICSVLVLGASLGVNWLALGLPHRASLHAANSYALSVPFTLMAGVFSAALLAEGRVGAYWATKIFTAAATTLPVFLLAAVGALSIRTYIIAAILAAIAGALVAATAQRTSPIVLRVPDKTLARSVLLFGSTTTFTLLPYQLNLRLDQMVMSMFAPAKVLGPYAVAFAWASTLSVVGSGFSSVILSRSTRLDAQNADQVAVAARTLRVAFIFFVVLGGLAAAATPLGIPLLFGPNYQDAVIPGIILCLASIPLYTNLMLHDFLRGLGFPAVGSIPELLGLVGSGIGLAILFPRFGSVGAAFVSLLSYSVVLGSLCVRVVQKVPNFRAEYFAVSSEDVVALFEALRRVRRRFA